MSLLQRLIQMTGLSGTLPEKEESRFGYSQDQMNPVIPLLLPDRHTLPGIVVYPARASGGMWEFLFQTNRAGICLLKKEAECQMDYKPAARSMNSRYTIP